MGVPERPGVQPLQLADASGCSDRSEGSEPEVTHVRHEQAGTSAKRPTGSAPQAAGAPSGTAGAAQAAEAAGQTSGLNHTGQPPPSSGPGLSWWERWPGRLQHEFDELRSEAIFFEQDRQAERDGIIRLRTRHIEDGQAIELIATYPDLFPHFRIEIAAPAEKLEYHQHPHSKFLCLFGRATENWDQDLTLARLIRERLPRVLAAARTRDREVAAKLEEQQAEPFSDYYQASNGSMLLIDSAWRIDRAEKAGPLTLVVADHDMVPGSLLRGLVVDVRSDTGRVLASAHDDLRKAFRGQRITARWIRSETPIAEFDAPRFFQQVERLDRRASENPVHSFKRGRLQIWGVLFPEEATWRDEGRVDGWIFVCRFDRELDLVWPQPPAGVWPSDVSRRQRGGLRSRNRKHRR